jgi:hypothetical protein
MHQSNDSHSSVHTLLRLHLLAGNYVFVAAVLRHVWRALRRCAYQVEQGGGNLPARLSLMAFPERTELRQKNLFSVAGARNRVAVCLDSDWKLGSATHLRSCIVLLHQGQLAPCSVAAVVAALGRMARCAMWPAIVLERPSSPSES